MYISHEIQMLNKIKGNQVQTIHYLWYALPSHYWIFTDLLNWVNWLEIISFTKDMNLIAMVFTFQPVGNSIFGKISYVLDKCKEGRENISIL